MQAISSDPVQCCIVQDDDTVSIDGQTFQGQQRIVRLNNDITGNDWTD